MKEERPAAKKSLGQHFLRRPEICEKIVRLACIEADDSIVEIGPGPGALTKVVEAVPHKRLLLLEKDSYWAELRDKEAAPKTEVRCMDALTYPWEELAGWIILGNLPYNVASPLIWDIASRCRGIKRAVFMVQKEVGERLAAKPGSKEYGALSVWVQAYLIPHLDFCVGPGAFLPPPKVDSAVLSFTPRPEEELPQYPKDFERVIKLCFQQRRKQLGSLFKKQKRLDLLQTLQKLGIPETARPEELSLSHFLALSASSAKATS